MTSEEVQRLRSAYDAWSRGDLEGTLIGLDPAIEFRMSGLFPDLEPVYRGHEGIRRFWDQFHEAWEQLSIEPEEIRQSGDRIVALFRFRGTGRDGIEVERPFAHLWTLRDGRFVLMQAYADQREALDAMEGGSAARR